MSRCRCTAASYIYPVVLFSRLLPIGFQLSTKSNDIALQSRAQSLKILWLHSVMLPKGTATAPRSHLREALHCFRSRCALLCSLICRVVVEAGLQQWLSSTSQNLRLRNICSGFNCLRALLRTVTAHRWFHMISTYCVLSSNYVPPCYTGVWRVAGCSRQTYRMFAKCLTRCDVSVLLFIVIVWGDSISILK